MEVRKAEVVVVIPHLVAVPTHLDQVLGIHAAVRAATPLTVVVSLIVLVTIGVKVTAQAEISMIVPPLEIPVGHLTDRILEVLHVQVIAHVLMTVELLEAVHVIVVLVMPIAQV